MQELDEKINEIILKDIIIHHVYDKSDLVFDEKNRDEI